MNLLDLGGECEGGEDHSFEPLPIVDTAFTMRQCRRCAVVETVVDHDQLRRPHRDRMRDAWTPELQAELDALAARRETEALSDDDAHRLAVLGALRHNTVEYAERYGS